MANTLLTNDIILRTALMEFQNNLVFAKTARRDYQDKFNPTTGNTIRIRKPTRYESRTGETISVQPINEQYTSITVGDMVGVDVEVTSRELALQLDDFNREILNPAMVTLANKIDSLLYGTTIDISSFVGTAGTAPSTFAVANNANALLNSFGVPQGKDRFMLLKSFDAAALQNALYNTFNENFNKEIILDGSMGNLASFDCYSVQNVIRPDVGTVVASIGTPAINGANQSGSSLILDGFTAGAVVKAGRTFTIAGVNSLNPTSRTDTGQLAQFVATADATADGSGNMTLSVSMNGYPLTLTGPYRNISAAPADNALLTFNNVANLNIAYHKEAFALVTIKLPEGADGAYQRNMMDPKAKINIRMTRQYQISNDKNVIRFDVLPAVKCFPEYATRILGS